MSSDYRERPGTPGAAPQRGAGPTSFLARTVKRDGREVPFDRVKIRDAVARAQAAVGERDPQFAEEVAAVVTLTLEQRYRPDGGRADAARRGDAAELGGLPHIEEIQDLVEDALIGMGRAAVAKAYILYRDRRNRVRQAVSIDTDGRPGPRVVQGERSADWSKSRIVAALLAEADLPRATAEQVAARVEERVFSSGLRRVSTALVRELVAGELMDMGLTAALRRQASVGLPKHDLRRLLSGVPLQRWESLTQSEDGRADAAPARVDQAVSSEVMRRFALEEVWSESSVERHLSGELSLIEPGRPYLHLSAAVPAELLLTGDSGPAAAFEAIESLVSIALTTSQGIVLEDPGQALLPLVRATRAGSPMGLAAWLRALSAAARGAGRAFDLGSPGTRFPSFTVRLVEALAALPSGPFTPRLYLRDGELSELVAAHPGSAGLLDDLVRRGQLIVTWGRDDVRCVAPGCHRRARERAGIACGGAVALNLPRAARSAGPWREELLLETLSGLVQCAVGACRELDAFQRQHTRARAAAPSARVSYSIAPVGLREALRHVGGGEIDVAQGARIVGFLAEAARRFSAGDGPEVVLDAHFGARAAARLAHLDSERARGEGAEQPWLFEEVASAEPDQAYSHGFALSPVPGQEPGAAEAELCTTIPSGALVPAPAPRRTGALAAGDAGDTQARLEVCERFCALRPGEDGAPRDLLFPLGAGALRKGPRGLVRSPSPSLHSLGESGEAQDPSSLSFSSGADAAPFELSRPGVDDATGPFPQD